MKPLERRLVRLEARYRTGAFLVVRLPSEAMGDDPADARGDCGASALHRLDGAGDAGAGRMTQAEWVARARVCVRAVATALARLRELGILNWVRRCVESWRDGRFVLEQQTNAYAVLPDSQWRGYRPPWSRQGRRRGRGVNRRPCRPRCPGGAGDERADGRGRVLATDPGSPGSRAGRLGRAFMARDS